MASPYAIDLQGIWPAHNAEKDMIPNIVVVRQVIAMKIDAS